MNGTVVQVFVNGVSLTSVYALVAVGITMVFGHTRLVNFAHGQVLVLSAYVAMELGGGVGLLPFLATLLVAMATGGVVSLAMERGLFRFTLNRPVNGFLISMGLVILLQNAIQSVWGSGPRGIEPVWKNVFDIGGAQVSAQRLTVVVLAAVLIVALYLLLRRSWTGLAMRATSVDREALALMGAPVTRIITGTFVVGGVLAGAAGVLVASVSTVTPFYGLEIVVKGFTIALVGGLGSITGSIVVAVVFGLGEAAAQTAGLGAWVDALVFGVLIVVMLVRPMGLFRGVEAGVD